MWNVTSMVYKTMNILEHLLDHQSTIVFNSETWLRDDVSYVNALVKSFGYILVHNRRKNRAKLTGGGVGILLRLNMKHKQIHVKSYSSFKITVVKLFMCEPQDSVSKYILSLMCTSQGIYG